jgi:hypothetical protein
MPVWRRLQALFEAALWLCAAKAAWEAVRYFQGTRGRFHAESALMILTAGCVTWALCFPARSDSHRPPAAPEPIQKWLPALLTLAALLLYRPALGLGLLSDDYVLIERAASGAALRPSAGEFYRPLPLLLLGVLGAWPWALRHPVSADPVAAEQPQFQLSPFGTGQTRGKSVLASGDQQALDGGLGSGEG